MKTAPRQLVQAVADRGRTWARRRQGTDRGTVTLGSRRIYILPTAQGVAFGAMIFLMLIGSMNYNNSVGLAVTFALTAFALVVMHHCHRSLTGLRVKLVDARPVFAGQIAQFPVELQNEATHARLDLGVFVDKSLVDIVSLAPGECRVLPIELAAATRGELELSRFSVRCRYPAALFQTWAWLNTDLKCLVYPKPAEHAPPPPEHAQAEGQSSLSASGNDDFAGVRDYRAGDPAGRIAWKAYARTNVLAIKTFTGGARAPFTLRLADAAGTLESRLSVLTRWCLDAVEDGRAFALELDNTCIGPGRGRAHLDQCLRQLALYR